MDREHVRQAGQVSCDKAAMKRCRARKLVHGLEPRRALTHWACNLHSSHRPDNITTTPRANALTRARPPIALLARIHFTGPTRPLSHHFCAPALDMR